MGRTQEHVQANSFSLKIMSSVTICCDSEEHPLFHLETISFGCTTYFALTLNNQKTYTQIMCATSKDLHSLTSFECRPWKFNIV
jgi:hypothetical protein